MEGDHGYLYVDHRASPGLAEDEARWCGYGPSMTGSKVIESKTLTCSHCKSVVVPNPLRTRERAKCMKCKGKSGHYVCDGCAYLMTLPDYVHAPFEAKVEAAYIAANRPIDELPLLDVGTASLDTRALRP